MKIRFISKFRSARAAWMPPRLSFWPPVSLPRPTSVNVSCAVSWVPDWLMQRSNLTNVQTSSAARNCTFHTAGPWRRAHTLKSRRRTSDPIIWELPLSTPYKAILRIAAYEHEPSLECRVNKMLGQLGNTSRKGQIHVKSQKLENDFLIQMTIMVIIFSLKKYCFVLSLTSVKDSFLQIRSRNVPLKNCAHH